jgi:hypothetical protein
VRFLWVWCDWTEARSSQCAEMDVPPTNSRHLVRCSGADELKQRGVGRAEHRHRHARGFKAAAHSRFRPFLRPRRRSDEHRCAE